MGVIIVCCYVEPITVYLITVWCKMFVVQESTAKLGLQRVVVV